MSDDLVAVAGSTPRSAVGCGELLHDGAFGTDRYPPFSLGAELDYPATLDIAYPEHLSRGLVLVKWWLQAISHDLVLGLGRWVLRVADYVALMTDSYPSFRLDLGGADPATLVVGEPSPEQPPAPVAPVALERRCLLPPRAGPPPVPVRRGGDDGVGHSHHDSPCPAGGLRPGAAEYAQDTRMFQYWRDELVRALPLRPGDTVIDVGCGSGLCLPGLRAKVGPTGHVVGVEEAPAMAELARAEVERKGWREVTLLTGTAERFNLPAPAGAALFCAVHDVLMSRTALDNVFAQLRPGAWVVAGGGKWPPMWNVPLTALVAALHAPYVRDLAGFDRPWQVLEESSTISSSPRWRSARVTGRSVVRGPRRATAGEIGALGGRNRRA